MDEKTFLRGRYSPEEGGPKGVDITNNMSMFVTTCHNQTLAFFDLETILQEHRRDRNIPPSNYSDRRSEEHTSELQSPLNLVCRHLLEKKKIHYQNPNSTVILLDLRQRAEAALHR